MYNKPELPYFLDYDREANDPTKSSRFASNISVARKQIEGIMRRIDPVTTVVLGSATERNIKELRWFTSRFRDLNRDDKYIFLDIANHPLERHFKWVKDRGVSDVFMVQADMNRVPFPSNIADLVIVDYTINFNLSLSGYDDTLKTVSRLLKSGGKCVLTAMVHPNIKSRKSFIRADDKATLTAFSSDLLGNLIRKNNLTFTELAEPAIGDKWKPAVRLILEK